MAQPGAPIWAKTLAWMLLAKRSAITVWHWPHTFPTHDTPGGAAPWFPWQSLQVGAERSPFTDIVAQWTLPLYFFSWSVGILYSSMYLGSAWQRPQVSATRTGCTLEVGSDGGLIECAGWQLVQTATLAADQSTSVSVPVSYATANGAYFEVAATTPNGPRDSASPFVNTPGTFVVNLKLG